MASQGFLIVTSAFLYALKKVSLLRTISIKTQIGKTAIITATIIPNGFIMTESMILPCKSNETDRVVPQEGQGYPVTFLIIHTLKLPAVTV
jgi:hypothetical protein